VLTKIRDDDDRLAGAMFVRKAWMNFIRRSRSADRFPRVRDGGGRAHIRN